jgi:deoxyribodipyrimidine photo-lyase
MASAAKKAKLDLPASLTEHRAAAAKDVMEFKASKHGESFKARVQELVGEPGRLRRECKAVVYWMWRDRRVQDNWALLHAQAKALELGVPLHVVFCLPPAHGEMTLRHYTFLLEGLKEVEQELRQLGIGFQLVVGEPPDQLTPAFLAGLEAGLVVADFSPLREHRAWLGAVRSRLEQVGEEASHVALHQVDAHNVVPVWTASDKQEYAARTIRPKITRQLAEFLTPFPPVVSHRPRVAETAELTDWKAAYKGLQVDREGWGVAPVSDRFSPGTMAGLANLQGFVQERIKGYGARRNDPNAAVLSDLSPWINHGQVSMQRAVLVVKAEAGSAHAASVAAFVEEAVVRRELSDNFCLHNAHYDSLEGATDWARKTLKDHAKDKREYVYSRAELEEARTHDDLWNASQLQLVHEGKLHGFLRMYWAKKVLEWTVSPEAALREALRLNDRYALDGNDPNGFVGVMWSVAGIHDQGWAERPVFGKIRYMNYAGCKRKFDVNQFVLKYGAKVHGK